MGGSMGVTFNRKNVGRAFKNMYYSNDFFSLL
jgi:hypothetical protein